MSASVLDKPVAESQVRATQPHFTVTKSDLVRELLLAVGSVERKTTIPILSNVRLEADGEKLIIQATDLQVAIATRCEATVKVGGAATLPAKRLLDYVRLLPDGDIELKFDARNWVTISAGRSRTRLAGMSVESFPDLPQPISPRFKVPVSALDRMFAGVLHSVTNEETRFALRGCLLEVGDHLRMVATDGHRLALAEAKMPSPVEAGRVLVPREAMALISKLHAASEGMATVEVGWDDNQIFLCVGARTLTARRLVGSFPDYSRVLPQSFKQTVLIDRQALRDSIARVRNFADERTRYVKFDIEEASLRVVASLADMGESEENIPIELTGEPMSIAFNGNYLIESLDAMSSDRVCLRLSGGNSAMQMEPVSEEGKSTSRYLTVVMPMRV